MFNYIKKFLIIPVILSMCLSLFNINNIKAETTSNEIAKVTDKSEEWINQNLAVSLLYPEVKVPSNPIAERNINSAIKEYIDKVKAAADDIQKMVDGKKNSISTQYYCTTDYVVTHNKNNLLSIVIIYDDYTGGAHEIEINEPLNFDLTTGKQLSIKDLFKEEKVEQAVNLINKTVSTGFENSNDAIFKFESINDDVKFYLADTYMKVYFNPYEYTPYSAGTPTFKIPYTVVSDMLKYEDLKNTNFRYNDEDIVYLLERDSENLNGIAYVPQMFGFNMDKATPEISMLYTAAKYIDDNIYSYYITPDELETFIYHVYGRKINAYDIIKGVSDKSYEMDNLQCKNGLYTFSSKRPTNFLTPTLEKTVDNNNATTDAYGLIDEYSQNGDVKNTYGFKLTFMKSSNSCFGYNILNYNIEQLDYSDMVSEKIDNMFKEK